MSPSRNHSGQSRCCWTFRKPHARARRCWNRSKPMRANNVSALFKSKNNVRALFKTSRTVLVKAAAAARSFENRRQTRTLVASARRGHLAHRHRRLRCRRAFRKPRSQPISASISRFENNGALAENFVCATSLFLSRTPTAHPLAQLPNCLSITGSRL